MVASIERYRALAKHSQDRLFVAGARQNGCRGGHFGVVLRGLLCFFFWQIRLLVLFVFFCLRWVRVDVYWLVWVVLIWVEENIGLVVRWLDFWIVLQCVYFCLCGMNLMAMSSFGIVFVWFLASVFPCFGDKVWDVFFSLAFNSFVSLCSFGKIPYKT